jgi:CheY-like chemotaxis protein
MNSQESIASYRAGHTNPYASLPYASPLDASPRRRKVLIVEDEPSISNLLYVLLEGLNYDGEVAWSGPQALAMIGRESFDAVLLDLRYSNLSAKQMVTRITDVRPSLAGRVLVVPKQEDRPPAREPLERHRLHALTQNRMMVEVQQSLRGLWAIPALAQQA